jgi:hypothetical protein
VQETVFHKKLSRIYQNYNLTIKPLIADIESRYQRFPDSLFNEIRALHDHLARCYTTGHTDEQTEGEMKKAESHVLRITFDCYKYLDVWFYDYIENFEKKYANRIDITLINNGEFAPEFRRLRSEATKGVREAKKKEGTDKQGSFDAYQKAYNLYSELEVLIDSNVSQFSWAKFHKRASRTVTTVMWILSVIISSLITIAAGCDDLIRAIQSLFR